MGILNTYYVYGHFVTVHLNLTYIQCIQNSFFEHLFNLYCRRIHFTTIYTITQAHVTINMLVSCIVIDLYPSIWVSSVPSWRGDNFYGSAQSLFAGCALSQIETPYVSIVTALKKQLMMYFT